MSYAASVHRPASISRYVVLRIALWSTVEYRLFNTRKETLELRGWE